METIAKIRRDYYVAGKSIRGIARDRKLSRNTVRKVIREGRTKFQYVRTKQPLPKLEKHREQLEALLSSNQKMHRKQRRTLRQMHEELCSEGYEGSYDAVCHYARKWRREHAADQSAAFVPLSFQAGEAYQFDWSEERVWIGDNTRRVQMAQMTLCYSRQPFLRGYPRMTQEMLFDAHNQAFAWYGGSCKRGIYDNMKTAVNQVKFGRERRFNSRFEQLCAHFLVQPQACTPAAGWEKGRVEKQVQDLRRALLPAAAKYASLEAFNEHLQAAALDYSQKRPHPEDRSRSVYEVFLKERSSLIPFVEPFDAWRAVTATVSKCLLVHFDSNRYSVAAHALGRPVEVQAFSERVVIRLDGEVVADHPRSFGRGETIYEPMHYLPVLRRKPGAWQNGAPFVDWQLPSGLQQVRERLAGFDDGNRQMVEILSAAQRLGFECVDAACLQALSEGCFHADVVLNLAHRRAQPQAPEALPTPPHLRLRIEPEADCKRYDQLRRGRP